QTVANSEGRHVARGDSPYTELGRRQAVMVADALAAWAPGVVVSSPQRRALVPALGSSLPLRFSSAP
ncbi:MAG: histidine phosphatase family protein, partial [candidate division Zixibacteria bacterium]|nr:histidine phosphatase family protein [candidate division Zixibacteria bacterium]